MTSRQELVRASSSYYTEYLESIEEKVREWAEQGGTIYVQRTPFEITSLFLDVAKRYFTGCYIDGISRTEFYIRWD